MYPFEFSVLVCFFEDPFEFENFLLDSVPMLKLCIPWESHQAVSA